MSATPFDTDVLEDGGVFIGPWRSPRQMLGEQTYDDHTSIHDEATAQKLGFAGAAIEGPTHFSQFAPLGVAAWGEAFIARGCVSSHFRNPVIEGERVRAHMAVPAAGERVAEIWMVKEDGAEVLRGTASIGPDHPTSELDRRLAALTPLEQPVILEGVQIGARQPRIAVTMGADQHMGDMYPFSLSQKLTKITEPSAWYADGAANPYGKAVIPMEMISVLINHAHAYPPFYAKGPVVGLFADQEIRLIDGPLFVGEAYEIDRQVVGMSGSRRTESLWIETRIYRPGSKAVIATSLLNSALLKDSFEAFETERARLYG